MNNKKISFLTCVNNEETYKECLSYIEKLKVPSGYEVEIKSKRNAQSLTATYNELMESTDAKYKVYLHQDTFIINENFIEDILNIFKQNEDLGMLGVIGSKDMPSSGVWWHTNDIIGKVYAIYSPPMITQGDRNPDDYIEDVLVIDGLIMITQYDLKWRSDIFNGWHFYDLSQCFEFIRNGYRVAVPRQENIWCIHACGTPNMSNYDLYRLKFIETYLK